MKKNSILLLQSKQYCNLRFLVKISLALIVFLAGISSAVSGDVSISKEFGNVYAKDSDNNIIASGTAGTDDATVIQAGFDNITSSGTISFDGNSYSISASITSTDKNLVMQGSNTTFDVDTGSSAAGFNFDGSYKGSVTFALDANEGDNTVNLTSAAIVSVGDLIRIYNDELWCPDDYPTHLTGETYIVEGVSGNIVTLNSNLIRDYTTALNSSARIYRPATVELNDCRFIGIGSEEYVRGISLKACKDSSISNCYFNDNGLAAIYLHYCHTINVSKNEIYNSNIDGLGYGVAVVNACSNITIYNNTIENCRHCITSGDSSDLGVNRDVYILNNTMRKGIGKSSVVDAHPSTINYLVANNTIYADGGLAFADGTIESTFRDNYVYDGYAINKRGNIVNSTKIVTGNHIINGTIIYQNADRQIKEFIITDNYVEGDSSDYGIYLNDMDVEKLTFTGNTIKGMNYGILLYIDESKPSNISISKNIFEEAARCAITMIYQKISSDECILNINNNTIKNVNRADSDGGHGIQLNNTQNATIYGNQISDDDNLTRCGIYEDADCDYNYIYDNRITGMKIGPVCIKGPNTVAENNGDITLKRGDLNNDEKVNIQDIQLCVNVILGAETNPGIVARADANDDGQVNNSDIEEIVNIILTQ